MRNVGCKIFSRALLFVAFLCGGVWCAHATRILPQTFLSCQAQFYPISETARGGISRWHDVPLFLDNALEKGGANQCYWSAEQMEIACRELKEYGFDAFSFFPDTYNRIGVFNLQAAGIGKAVKLVPIFTPTRLGARYEKDEIMRRIVANEGLEVGGKKVIYAYKTGAFSGNAPSRFAAAVRDLRQTYGDKFLFMADTEFLSKYRYAFAATNGVSQADCTAAKAELRRWLDVADGIYFGEVHMLQKPEKDERIFDEAFYREFVIRLMREVLEEAPYRGQKLLGLAALVGHENNGQWGYYLSCDGTKTLRNSFRAAAQAKPDYINFCEWDEWNENTSLCPTIRSATASKRILRALFAEMRGAAFTPLKGDDLSIPNLILSTRAVLAYGEILKIEVLNVPEGNAGPITFTLTLLDGEGAILQAFPRVTLPADKLCDHTFEVASENFAPQRVIRYRLETDWQGRHHVWESGLQHTQLRVSAAWHYRWNKTPLRDLATGVKAHASAHSYAYSGDENLAYVSVWEDDEIVAAPDPTGFEEEWREGASNYVFAVNFFSARDFKAKGTMEVLGAGDAVAWRDANNRITAGPKAALYRVSNWCADTLLRLPKASVKGAQEMPCHLRLSTPDIGEVLIELAKVVQFGTYVTHTTNGVTVAVDRYRFQRNFPRRQLGVKAISFPLNIVPATSHAVISVEAVTQSGKIWHSPPKYTPSEKTRPIIVHSAHARKAVKIEAPASEVPLIRYDFSNQAGDIILNSEGGLYRRGILGAPASFATFANRHYGYNASYPFAAEEWAAPQERKLSANCGVPTRHTEAGSEFLRFQGGDFMLLPQGVLPRVAAWKLAFKMRPKALGSLQTPFACRWGKGSPGSFWMTILEDGRIRLDYAGLAHNHTRRITPLKVNSGTWNDIVVHYGVDTISLKVNGVNSPTYPCVSPGRFDLLCIVGGYEGEWFTGDIANLSIEYEGKNEAKVEGEGE